jgi:hypothetical protein
MFAGVSRTWLYPYIQSHYKSILTACIVFAGVLWLNDDRHFRAAQPDTRPRRSFADNFNADPCVFGAIALPNWVISSADGSKKPSVDVLGTGPGCISAIMPVDGNYLDLHGTTPDASGSDNATITSIATFQPGEYILTFQLGNNGLGAATGPGADNRLQVSLGSFTQTLPAMSGTRPFSPQTLVFKNTIRGAHLVFAALGNTHNDSGPLLDSVDLRPR